MNKTCKFSSAAAMIGLISFGNPMPAEAVSPESFSSPPQTPQVKQRVAPVKRAVEKRKSPTPEQEWNNISKSTDINVLQEFYQKHSTSPLAAEAALRIEWLHKEQQKQMATIRWQAIINSQNPTDFQKFITDFPESPFTTDAAEKLATTSAILAEEEKSWINAEKKNTQRSYIKHIERFPTGKYTAKALERIEKSSAEHLLWERAKKNPNVGDIKDYLIQFPDGIYKDQAQEIIKKLETQRSPAPTLESGNMAIVDCAVCPKLIRIPAGKLFTGDRSASDTRTPHEFAHVTELYIGQYEVTATEFQSCILAKGCKANSYARNPSKGMPMSNISWNDAQDYTRWLRSKTGKTYRLPTEIEWEYAARSNTTTAWYNGNSDDKICQIANINDQNTTDSFVRPPCTDNAALATTIGSYQPNHFGLYDMIGNLHEWTQDCFVNSPVAVTTPERANNCSARTLRGGSWQSLPNNAKASSRRSGDPNDRYWENGFRIVREP